MPYRPNWKLIKPKPIHFRAAELCAYGFVPKDVARICRLSTNFIYRLRGSPRFQQMIAEARRSIHLQQGIAAQKSLRETDPQDAENLLSLSELTLMDDLVHIRDRSPNIEHKLRACAEVNKQLKRLYERKRERAESEVRVVILPAPPPNAKTVLPSGQRISLSNGEVSGK